MTSPRWIALAVIAALVMFGSAWRDYSEAAFWFGVGVLIYFVLLALWPDAARIWFCLGGGLAGAYVGAFVGIVLIHAIFSDGWTRFGAAIWIGPPFAIVGAVAGFCIVLHWTKPPEAHLPPAV